MSGSAPFSLIPFRLILTLTLTLTLSLTLHLTLNLTVTRAMGVGLGEMWRHWIWHAEQVLLSNSAATVNNGDSYLHGRNIYIYRYLQYVEHKTSHWILAANGVHDVQKCIWMPMV